MIRKEKNKITNITFLVCVINSSISNVQLESLHPINYVPQNQKDKDGTETFKFYIFIFFLYVNFFDF